jgi:ubiquinone biosynthesis protein UbiJ
VPASPRYIAVSKVERANVLNNLASAVAHHLLEQADWARSRLSEHAGKRVRVELPLGPLSVEIAEDGQVLQVALNEAPDLVISLSPLAAVQWFTDRQAAWRQARVEGDGELAAAISHVASNLRWDFEEDLSRVVGDVAAQRVGQGVRRFSTWPGEAAGSVARGAAEYLTEESHLLATPLQVEEFAKNVDQLRDSVERLEKRMDRLADTIAGSQSP